MYGAIHPLPNTHSLRGAQLNNKSTETTLPLPLQVMKILIPLRYKYSPQHPVPKHPRAVFFP